MPRIRYLIAAIALAIIAYCTIPNIAFAADAGAPGNDLGQIRVPAALVTLLVSLFLPIITGWLTKGHWPARAKDAVTIVLNAVNVLVVGAIIPGGAAVLSFDTLFVWAVSTATSIATYFRVLKPAGVTSSIVEVDGRDVPGKLSEIGVK